MVVVKPRASANVAIDSTTSSGQDAIGLSGWSIKNYFYWNNSGTWTNQSGTDEALRITVNGYEGAPVVVTPPVVTTGTEVWAATLTVGVRTVAGLIFYGWAAHGNYTGASFERRRLRPSAATYVRDQSSSNLMELH